MPVSRRLLLAAAAAQAPDCPAPSRLSPACSQGWISATCCWTSVSWSLEAGSKWKCPELFSDPEPAPAVFRLAVPWETRGASVGGLRFPASSACGLLRLSGSLSECCGKEKVPSPGACRPFPAPRSVLPGGNLPQVDGRAGACTQLGRRAGKEGKGAARIQELASVRGTGLGNVCSFGEQLWSPRPGYSWPLSAGRKHVWDSRLQDPRARRCGERAGAAGRAPLALRWWREQPGALRSSGACCAST